MKPLHPMPFPAGPGSQPTEPDGAELDCLPLPREMATYEPPRLPEPGEAQSHPQALELLERALLALKFYCAGDAPLELDLAGLSSADLELVEQTLGEGEVRILIAGRGDFDVYETRLAGVWRVRSGGAVGRDRLEVADIPRIVRATAFTGAAPQVELPESVPDGVMNAPAVLVELNAQCQAWQPGELPHIVNLTLLPQTPEDLAYLDRCLGWGSVSIVSRGYGSCRIDATALVNCWWVRHFNSEDRPLLTTLEVVDVPAAALAAQEDIEDSASRLAEILEALR